MEKAASFVAGLAALSSLLLVKPAQAADIGIMPVSVQLDRNHDRSTVQVINNGTEAVVLQADAIAWKREGGIDKDGPTSDLLVNPPVFTIQPGQTQIVRVGLRRSANSQQETTYRMVLREVPSVKITDSAGVSGSVRVLVTMRVPVYVAPQTVNRDERWKAARNAQGQIVASVENAGNVHYKVGALRVRDGSPKQLNTSDNSSGTVLFPGETRSFALSNPGGVEVGSPLTLEVMTDRGPQHVALELAFN